MIGWESEPLSLKREYALICNIRLMMRSLISCCKTERFSKVETRTVVKREQEIAVKYLLLGKNVLAVLPTGYGKSLIFTLFLLARENI
jgi:superfamily II DNA helicase RecQ